MNKVYARINWKNYPSEETPLNESNLNKIDYAVNELDNRIIEQDTTKANVADLSNNIKDWTMDDETGIITIEKYSGEMITFDLNIEKIPVSFTLSEQGVLTMTTDDGTTYTADIGAMIPILTFSDSSTIAVSVSGTGINKTYSFSIKNGSVTDAMLETDYLAEINVAMSNVQSTATAAQSAINQTLSDAEDELQGYVDDAQTSETNAATSETNASNSATLAQSWAVGHTNTRQGEDTNNAQYWAQQAQTAAQAYPMEGATDIADGASGFVPTPLAGDNRKVLWGDGTWRKAGHTIVDENGNSYNARTNLKFVNAEIQDDELTDTTIITVQGGGGVNLPDVSGASISSLKRVVSLTWSDPDDVIVDGTTLATWGGTLVVKKQGSAPSNRLDGTVVADSTVRNSHASVALIDNDVEYGNTYYYRFFPYTTGGSYTNGSSVSVAPTRVVVQTIPSQSGTLEYDGTSQSPTWDNYNPTELTIGGDTDGVNSDTYTATFTPSADYTWDDGRNPKSVSWVIGKMNLDTPTQNGSLVYDGTPQTPTWDNYDTDYMTLTETAETAVGQYSSTFTLIDTENTKFGGTDDTSVTVFWSINDAVVAIPTVTDTSKTYDGTEQSVTVSSYDSNIIEVTGTSATNAGDYTVTMHLLNANYRWSDDSTADKTVAWSIAKAQGSFSISNNSVTLNASTLTATVTVLDIVGGGISVATSDSNIATATLSNGTITISSVNNTTGTATITVSQEETANYLASTPKTISVTAQFVTIYGAEWDGTSTTAWSRTDAAANFVDPSPAVNNGNGSSPFDTCYPWSGITVENNTSAGKLVKIPKFWYKWTRNGTRMKLQIADAEVSGFHVSPAHADRGDGKGERDYVYVGTYHCATSTYKSTSGVQPQASVTRANFRSSIHNLGSNIWQWDYAMLWTIQMLYLVEYADWNSQAKIGYGCSDSGSKQNSGLTDSMIYHTGTNAANRTTYGHTRYRYIEDLWGNVYDWCDGIYFSSANVYCIKNPANFSDTSGGTLVGSRATSGGYISGFTSPTTSGFEYALYPNAVAGSDSTYVPDYCSYDASGVVLRVGGSYSQVQDRGLFYLYGYDTASVSGGNIGSRLQLLA